MVRDEVITIVSRMRRMLWRGIGRGRFLVFEILMRSMICRMESGDYLDPKLPHLGRVNTSSQSTRT